MEKALKIIKKILKIIGIILGLVVLAMVGLYLCFAFFYEEKDYRPPRVSENDINKVAYVEPTEEAKNFDLDGYIDSLPQVEYEKIDYPVKETYEYKFNNYKLSVDVPEGFYVYKIKTEVEKPYDTESIETSFREYWVKVGPAVGDWETIESDNLMCMTKAQLHGGDNLSREDCDGILFIPIKSRFRGVSYRDIFMHEIQFFDLKAKGVQKNEKFLADEIGDSRGSRVLLDDNQFLSIVCKKLIGIDKNYFYSIINSVKIEKI